MSDVTPPSATAPPPRYARFAKRDLEHTSWLAPLVNNRFGDLLNIELRHEQLFFVEAERIVEDVGYSEQGRRFSEAEFGKPMRQIADLVRFGYWFVGRAYDADAMREALRRQQDGYYYSIFSNQCQDWADRLARRAAEVERERGIAPSWRDERRHRFDREREVSPTEPASIALALVALALGVGGFLAPMVAGGAITMIFGAFFLASALSNLVYAFHARDGGQLLIELVIGVVHGVAGALLLAHPSFVRVATGVVIAGALAFNGIANVLAGSFGRPRTHWVGKLVAGLIMLASAAVITSHWPASGERVLGEAVGLSLLAGGGSTLLLGWQTRTAER